MDQFEVLVGNYGIKPQKSAPMASIKSGGKTLNSKPANSWSSSYGSSLRSESIIDDHDDPFQFNSDTGVKKQNNGGFGDFDIEFQFPRESNKVGNGASSGGSGLEFDVESVFRDSMNLGTKASSSIDYDDLLSGFSGNSTSAVNTDDLLSSTPKKVDSLDDLFGNRKGHRSGCRGPVTDNENRKNGFDLEDKLFPGFGSASTTNKGMNQYTKETKQESQEASFIDIESSSDTGGQYGTKEDGINEWNFHEAAPANAEVDLGSFFTSHGGKSSPETTSEVDIDSIFTVPNPYGTTRAGAKPIPVTEVDIDSIFPSPKPYETTRVGQKPKPVLKEVDTWIKPKNKPAPDFSSGFDFFGGGSTISAVFQEIEGEDDDRRRARYERYLKTEARIAQALADMNSREFQAQQEQEERHRIAETKDLEMKRWAAGKEGNLRALLSSLDQVLWPECGWKTLSLADLITSGQVKLAYKKAALYVHPDKVKQKGAQEKYVAEKVFDLLKEAWNKFNQEELR